MSTLTNYQKKALAYDKHISLTANAGSGKTTVLSKRYCEILIRENISINNIVAITFTEKAASELYSKIVKEFEDRILSADTKEKYKLEALRRSLVSAKISTIHSFCIDILKDFAPEAGIDANFSPIDARTADELLDQSLEEVINKQLINNSEITKNLIRIFGNRSLLINKVKFLFNKRKTIEKLADELYSNNTSFISTWMHNNFLKIFTGLFEEHIYLLIKNIKAINSISLEYKSTEDNIEINRLLNEINSKENVVEKYILLSETKRHFLTQKGLVKKRGYLSKGLYEENHQLIQLIENIFAELKNIEIKENYKILNTELAQFSKSLTEFYIEVNNKYESKKLQRSYLDFEDLLLFTKNLLNNNDVKNSLSSKYKYIMIDEYQDTNEIQYNIFMPILENLNRGNLFVVGDEKQSIYMFREAEVELFNKTKKEIEKKENAASLLELPHSFRLTPEIALFTNVLFKKLFKDPKPEFNEVVYNNLVCAYPKNKNGKVEVLLADNEVECENELVAKKILQLVLSSKNDYDFNDITILCKKRKNFLELEKIFSEYNIPFIIVGGKGFFQQQIILDIYSYLSFLINPLNDLALASILRAPYYGFSDVEIMKISLLKGKSLFDKLKKYCDENSNFKGHYKLLHRHLELTTNTDISELIRRIYNDTGYWSYLSNKKNGSQEIANIEKLIHKAISLVEQGNNTIYDFVIYLHDAINNLEDEGHADFEAGNNSVKIMTIHQSKGLEFKVVVLYKTNQRNFDETLKSKEIAIDKDFGLMAKLPEKNNYFEDYKQAPIIGVYNYVQNKKSVAELKRLLYVAITRTEEHLIISAGVKNSKIERNSFFDMISNVLKLDYGEEIVELNDELTFMKFVEDEYKSFNEKLSSSIKVTYNIDNITNRPRKNSSINKEFKINVKEIISTEKNEIISASKISLFLHCPKKYQLTYEFGYGELTKFFKDIEDYEFNNSEDEIKISGNIGGKIIHSVLEKNINKESIGIEVKNLIHKEEETILFSDDKILSLHSDITKLLEKFYNSESYAKISEYSNFINEAEFYKSVEDYFLYGIIDKLIIDENKLIIIDYKSDKVNSNNIKLKRETYFNQLMFYAFVIIEKYPTVKNIELQLIFIRDESFTSIKNINLDEINEFGNKIKISVEKIRKKEFDTNSEGCKDMKYYLLDECT